MADKPPSRSPAPPPPASKPVTTPPRAAGDPDELEREIAGKNISPEVARKILDKFPTLREDGLTSVWLSQRARGNAPAAAPPPETALALGNSIFVTLAEIGDGFDREIETAKKKARDKLAKWIADHDPKCVQETTTQALDAERALLDRIGYPEKK
jgi:hypothetical protein